MKKRMYTFWVIATALVLLGAVAIQAQVPVDVVDWGKTSNGKAWPILNTATTPAGSAGIGNGAKPTGWATIRGGFTPIEATLDKALVISGQVEFLGGGGASAYTHLRYALTNLDSATLTSQYTDSALWVSTKKHYGYEFCPRTGTGTISNGAWGVGTMGIIKNGNWNSTNSNGGPALASIKQAPTNAIMEAGLYNWAISVQPLPNGDNEVRWYLVAENNKYWFGGTVIDTSGVTTKFNGICFGFNSDLEATQVNLMSVQAGLGAPITVPEAPWEPFYINQWAKTSNGKAWPVLNDSTYLDGDAGIGNGAKPTGWATIRGGFIEPVTATLNKALIVKGQIEFVGGGGASAYTHLRYALTYLDSATLSSQYTDSALWVSTKKHYGYEFCPRTGTGTIANGAWGVGTMGVIKNGNWNSTNSNGGPALASIKQAPTNAIMEAGIYNWAISVQPLANGDNEVRWYLISENNKYWFGGTVIDTSGVTTKFNGVCFGFNNDLEATQVNLLAVEVDMGEPITVPEAPWEPFYVNQWGKTGRGTAWPILNDATYLDGDAGIGNGAKPTGWATIRGGFLDTITATMQKALIVKGQIEFVGGGGASAYTHLRYALTYQDSIALNYQNTDSAKWLTTGKSEKAHYGYEFCPRTGTGTISNGAWGVGTMGVIKNGAWNSTNSNGGPALASIKQAPTNAIMEAGIYNWAISVQPLPNGDNEVRWYLVAENNKYWFGGTVIDTSGVTAKFNGICFGFNSDLEATQVNLLAVEVDMGAPITVPEAPWEPFYINQWAKTSNGKAWPVLNDSTYLDGDAGIGNGAKPTGWATIRGGFTEPVTATTKKALIVKGQIEFVGGGGASAYTHLRYALTYLDSATLSSQYTDSALWVSTKKHYGYEFCPRTGTGTISNGAWGVGTMGIVKNGNWNSTNSNGGPALASIKQAPTNAIMEAGIYNWAISVQPLANGDNEVRWYLVAENNKYWFGGTVIDTSGVTTKFNGVCFGFNNDLEATQVNLMAVEVDMGEPITVPEAPWEPYYVNQWGKTSNGKAWPILNDATYLDGDAGLGNGAKPTGWATIRGGFIEPLTATTKKAVIVSGQLELLGGGGASAYTHLRYALTYLDSVTLSSQYTDSALWVSTKKHYGYEFCPRTGTGTISNGAWGVGTMGVIKNGNWNSTNSNGGPALASIKQAPTNAIMEAGIYNWAISVQPLANGDNEVRWYLVAENNKYWFGGTVIDTSGVTTKFNGICFGFGSDMEATQVNLMAVQVDMGEPITVPEAPWEPYYVSNWGFIGGYIGGWKYTPGEFEGDVTISGAAPSASWTAIEGAFDTPVTPKTDKALKITGKITLEGGGFESAGSLRFGLMDATASGSIINKNPDSTRWSGADPKHNGYLFIPVSGSNAVTDWSGISQQGSYGAVVNDFWHKTSGASNYVLGSILQNPATAVGGAGTYDFAISVQPLGNGTQEIRVKLIKSDNTYAWAAKTIDFHAPNVTTKFSALDFALKSATATSMKLEEVQIDLGAPIELPDWVVAVEMPQVTAVIPDEFALGQNYPNPFNPTTTMEISLPKSCQVNLVVYDALGKVVAELVNGSLNAGVHKINFNAINLPSGLYFYKLTAGEFSSTKKLMLLK